MLKFKLKPKVGNHTQRNPKTGEIETFKSDENKIISSAVDLVEMFGDKFERVYADEVQKAAEKGASELAPAKDDPKPSNDTKDEVDSQEDDADSQEDEAEAVSLGNNVTKKFEIAQEQDFKVFYKKGKGYFVTELEEDNVALNKKKMKKADVVPFIDSLLE